MGQKNNEGGKYYAVARGRFTGVFENWNQVRVLVERHPGALFQKFNNKKEAEDFVALHRKKDKENAKANKVKASKKLSKPDIMIQSYDNDGKPTGFNITGAFSENGRVFLDLQAASEEQLATEDAQNVIHGNGDDIIVRTIEQGSLDYGLLTDPIACPLYESLPVRREFNPTYFVEEKQVRRHWAFLGEVTEVNTQPLVVFVNDADLNPVQFHFASDVSEDRVLEAFIAGKTFAIMYYESGGWSDYLVGTPQRPLGTVSSINLRNTKTFKHCNLDNLGEFYNGYRMYSENRGKCLGCGDVFNVEKMKVCDGCNIVEYCSKKCEKFANDDGRHSALKCAQLVDVRFFFKFEWNKSEDGKMVDVSKL